MPNDLTFLHTAALLTVGMLMVISLRPLLRMLIRRQSILSSRENSIATVVVNEVNTCDVEVDQFGRDASKDENPADAPVATVHKKSKFKFIAACVVAAKFEFGECADIPANRMAVRKFLKDMMVLRGLRPTHAMNFLPMATALVFVPSNSEIEADRINLSDAVQNQRHRIAYGRTWFSKLVDIAIGRKPMVVAKLE
jgi:hypothetical protein